MVSLSNKLMLSLVLLFTASFSNARKIAIESKIMEQENIKIDISFGPKELKKSVCECFFSIFFVHLWLI